MAKASSPIRLQENLMQAATLIAKRFHRSTAEQIDYWADLGRTVSSVIDPDTLLSIASGLTTIKTESVFAAPVDPATVFDALEHQRESGDLSRIVSGGTVRYQASRQYPGYLEQLAADGHRVTGQFKNGQFIVRDEGAA